MLGRTALGAPYYDRVIKGMPLFTTNKELIMHAALHPSAHDSLQDIHLKCERFNEDGSVWGEDFVFNTSEQLRYRKLGFKNQPKSCKKHRGRPPPDESKLIPSEQLVKIAISTNTTNAKNSRKGIALMGTNVNSHPLTGWQTIPLLRLMINPTNMIPILVFIDGTCNSSYRGP